MSERPCRPCQAGEHDRCLNPLSSNPDSKYSRGDLGCCCDDLDRTPPRSGDG